MKISNETSTDWQRMGSVDPYWAVLTDDRFHSSTITDAARREFFESGERHLDYVIKTIHERISPDFAPLRVLDFGCGVGRVLVPIARRFPDATGVDVARSMLAEAKKNILEQELVAELVPGDDGLSGVTGDFDFIHSYIVLQHIPRPRGEKIIAGLLDRLRPGGIAALHVTYGLGLPTAKNLFRWARLRAPLVGRAWNVAKRRAPSTPYIEVYEYNLPNVLEIFRAHGCTDAYAALTDHGGVKGVFLFSQKVENV
jgi:SAM-dependent methyltransferase